MKMHSKIFAGIMVIITSIVSISDAFSCIHDYKDDRYLINIAY